MKKLLLLFITFFVGYEVNAQSFSEDFEAYTTATALVGQGNWVANSKYAGVSIKVDAPGIGGTPSAHINPGGEAGDGPVVPFSGTDLVLAKNGTGTIFVSFLVKFNSLPGGTNGNYFFYLADLTVDPVSSDGRGRIYAKPDPAVPATNKFAFGAIASSNSSADVTFTSYDYELGKTYLIIEKYEKVSGSTNADKVSLWIYKEGDVQSAVEITPTVANSSETAVSKKDIQGVGFRTMETSYNIFVDNIKADLAWSSVLTAVPLPVKLTSFAGAVQNSTVKLNWATASEQNNSHFDVLRSEDGKIFNILTSVSGNGTTQSVNNYSYIDASPLSGTNYYQLRQVDFDGKSELSKVIAVKTAMEKSSLSVHATSASAFAEISSYSLTNQKAVIQISPVSGSHIVTQTVNLIKGYNTLQIPMQIQPGVYVATLTAGLSSLSTKFVAQ